MTEETVCASIESHGMYYTLACRGDGYTLWHGYTDLGREYVMVRLGDGDKPQAATPVISSVRTNRHSHICVDDTNGLIYAVSIGNSWNDNTTMFTLVYRKDGSFMGQSETALPSALYSIGAVCFNDSRGWLIIYHTGAIFIRDALSLRVVHEITHDVRRFGYNSPRPTMWYDKDNDVIVVRSYLEPHRVSKAHMIGIDAFRYRDGKFSYSGSFTPDTPAGSCDKLYPGYKLFKITSSFEYNIGGVNRLHVTSKSFLPDATRHRTAFVACLLFCDKNKK